MLRPCGDSRKEGDAHPVCCRRINTTKNVVETVEDTGGLEGATEG